MPKILSYRTQIFGEEQFVNRFGKKSPKYDVDQKSISKLEMHEHFEETLNLPKF